jgi:Secretion system C-terminal sorting domain
MMNVKQTIAASVICLFTLTSIFAQTPLIDEEFEGAIPATWSSTSMDISTNHGCGGTTKCAFFNAANDALITPKLIDPKELKFLYLRSSNTAAWTLNIEYSTSNLSNATWISLVPGPVSDATTECQVFTADLSSLSNIYIRFIDARTVSSAAERYIDNVIVTQRDVALSVSILDFKATAVNNSVKLDWLTADEKDNSHFIIERSLDGKLFSNIGQVKGNGTTKQTIDYTFLDESNLSQTAYYRLKQIDFDGKSTVSKVISIDRNLRIGKTKIYPTLVNDWVTVELNTSNDVELIVNDIVGRVVLVKKKEVTEGATTFNLDLSGISKGMYFISVKSNFGIETTKIQKQ